MDLKSLERTPPWDWPEDAGARLVQILSDVQASQSERLLAAGLAGQYVVLSEEIVKALLRVVQGGDEAEEMRSVAAISLGPALEHADTTGFEDDDEEMISESVFLEIQQSLRKLFFDSEIPQEVRRRILEASVRAPQDWHEEAIREAYRSDDEAWRLTAVFCMCYVRGFDEEIVEALSSEHPEIHYEAVRAAGNWAVDNGWTHIARLVTSDDTDKQLRLAAIEAAVGIRPEEAATIVGDLTDSDDEDIVDAAFEALAMTEGMFGMEDLEDEEFADEDWEEEDFEDEEDEDEIVH